MPSNNLLSIQPILVMNGIREHLDNQKPIDQAIELTLNFRAEPDLEFEGLLKRQHTRVKYFQGSLMSAIDLERAKVNLKKATKKSKNFFASFYLWIENFALLFPIIFELTAFNLRLCEKLVQQTSDTFSKKITSYLYYFSINEWYQFLQVRFFL